MTLTTFGQLRRKAIKLLAFLAPVALLTACGGGSGGDGDLLTSGKSGTISFNVGTNTLPVQVGSYVDPVSSIYTTSVNVTALKSDGSRVTTGTPIQFNILKGKTSIGGMYPQPFVTEDITLPDGTIYKKPVSYWSYSVEAASGNALMLFHAGTVPGTVTIEASFVDPSSGKTVVGSTQITVGSPISTGLPATITATNVTGNIFVANQGKIDNAQIQISVADPANQPVSNPPAQNVQVELLNPAVGAVLVGQGGATGSIVRTTTTNGITVVGLRAGTTPGTANLRISADALDNNVENGIQNPIIDDVSVSISDGRAAAIVMTGPFVDAIKANVVTLPLGTGESFQDGTYLRLVSALVTDNLGNPVANSEVKFSLIDSPIQDYPAATASFVMSGIDGNPSEGGNRFDAPAAKFLGLTFDGTQIARVLRTDRLVLTPDSQGIDRALIGSRIISDVLSNTSLLVTSPFAASPNNGAAVPYVVGRAQFGVVGAVAYTNAQGVASTFLTYPVTRLNQPALITAEADNGISNVFRAAYVGILDYSMVSSVENVRAGNKTPVTLCVRDANSVPVPTGISFVGNSANVKVLNLDGTEASSLSTGANGCVSFIIDASTYSGTTDQPLIFTAGGTSAKATITVKSQGAGEMFVLSAVTNASPAIIKVVLLDESGNPIIGRIITAAGKATDADVLTNPAATIGPITVSNNNKTDNNGEVTITAPFTGVTGDTFEIEITAQGGATKTVNFTKS